MDLLEEGEDALGLDHHIVCKITKVQIMNPCTRRPLGVFQSIER
jgi:hypothetical protein